MNHRSIYCLILALFLLEVCGCKSVPYPENDQLTITVIGSASIPGEYCLSKGMTLRIFLKDNDCTSLPSSGDIWTRSAIISVKREVNGVLRRVYLENATMVPDVDMDNDLILNDKDTVSIERLL